jgi:hypothetical protein
VAGYKAVGVVFIRTRLRKIAPEAQLAVTAVLNDDERRLYQQCVPGDWVPIELIDKLGNAAAAALYPNAPDPLLHLGRELARDNLGGIYSFLVKLLTVPYLIEQTAKLWRTYHAQGEARSTRIEPNLVELAVTGYPDLPERFRHQMAGFVGGAVEMTGASDVVVEKGGGPDKWTWLIRWR